MSDMFISNVLILGIWLVIKMYYAKKRIYVFALALVVFLMIYTEWIGNFFAFAVFVMSLMLAFKFEQEQWRYWLSVAFACIVGVTFGLGLTFVQYSSIAGWEAYLAYFEHRFFARSAAQFTDNDFFSFLYKYFKLTKNVLKHYVTGFLPVLLLATTLLGWLLLRSKKIISQRNDVVRYFWWVAGFSVLMHHLIFIEFTVVHDFAVLKGGILIAVGIGLLTDRLTRSGFLYAGILATLLLCVVQYYYINRPGEISQNGDRYDTLQTLGETIKTQAAKDEIIFLNGYKPNPQVMYYARRNMLRAADTSEVKGILKNSGFERGILFTIDNDEIKHIERVSIE